MEKNPSPRKLSIIVCIAKNNAIGLNNGLLYHLRADLKHFRELTTGHTVIMGRLTYESLPKGALPDRRNIVLTRKATAFPCTEVFASLEEALAHCGDKEEVFVIGGASVYSEALPLARKLHLTIVDDTPSEADTFFPPIDSSQWQETGREHHDADEQNDKPFDFVDMVRV